MLTLLLWAIAVSVSLFGWGTLPLRLMRFPRMPLALNAAFGAAVAVLIGGFLNLENLLWVPVLRAFVLAGVALFAFELPARYGDLTSAVREGIAFVRRQPLLGALVFAVFTPVLLLALTSVQRKIFSDDDTAGYLVIAIKTVQFGSLPADPFSERRIVSSLGGNYFLKALMMPDGDFRSTGFPDTGFGYLLFIALAYQLGREFVTQKRFALAFAALAGALPFVRANEQMYILPAALFLACLLFILRASGWQLGLLLGTTCAAAASLKSSYMPFALSMPGLYYLLAAGRIGWRRTFGGLASAAISFAVVLLPWMADSKVKNGTWFYPILGAGFHVTAYLSRFPELRIHRATFLTFAAFVPLTGALLALCVLIFLDRKSASGNENMTAGVVAFLAAAALSTAAVGYATAGESVGRYSLPFIYPATLAGAAMLLHRWLQRDRRTTIIKCGSALAAMWIVFLVSYYGAVLDVGDYREDPLEIKSLFSDQLHPFERDVLTDGDVLRNARGTRQWQSMVPAGEPILGVSIPLTEADFSRNPIYIADIPGMSSPPPGMPFNSPEELLSYFRTMHIRYAAFADNLDDAADLKKLLVYKGRRVYSASELIASCETRLTLRKLRTRSEVVYDNGRVCLMRVY